MSLCLPVLGSRSQRRASSWPFLPLVTTLPLITGCPMSVMPLERPPTIALFLRSGDSGSHIEPARPSGVRPLASAALPPLLVILSFAALAKVTFRDDSCLNVLAVYG